MLSDEPKEVRQFYTKNEEELGEDATNTYLHSAQARADLMQKLMGQKEGSQLAQLNTLNPGQALA